MEYKTSLELSKLDDKIIIKVFIDPLNDGNLVYARKQTLLRQDLTPATLEVLKGYIQVYIKGLGEFFLDQTESTQDSMRVLKVGTVDTSAMTTIELSDELDLL